MSLNSFRIVAVRLINHPLTWICLSALPLLFIYANRFLIPDTATDTMTYHIFNGLRGLQYPFIPASPDEFYPVGLLNVNPIYDAVSAAARASLGYRLGTSIWLLAAIGSIIILFKMLRLIIREQGKTFHAGWGLLLLSASIVLELYFQVGTYFIDIGNSLAVLTVFYLTLKLIINNERPHSANWALVCLLFGILLLLKFTNAIFVIPMALLILWRLWRIRAKIAPKQWLVYLASFALVALPLVPSFAQNIALSGNPTFPFYNGVFKSDYYTPTNFADYSMGGQTLLERVFWPAASINQQERLAEPHPLYNDYKLIAYWATAIITAVLLATKSIRLGSIQKSVVSFFLSSVFLWGILFGGERYLIPGMLAGGLVVAIFITAARHNVGKFITKMLVVLAVALSALLAIEAVRIIEFNTRYDMSWRPPLIHNLTLHRKQLAHLWDNSITLNLSQQQTVRQADIWLNCSYNVAGFYSLIDEVSGKPAVNIIGQNNLPHYSAMSDLPAYRQVVHDKLADLYPTKKVYNWVAVVSRQIDSESGCLETIKRYGGTVNSTPIDNFLGYEDLRLTLISGQIPL